MTLKEYSFLSTWKFEASTNAVWQAVYDSLQWPEWWKDVTYAEELEPGDERGIGSVRTYIIQSPLLYSLRFSVTVTAIDEQHFINGAVSGQLAGTGNWDFMEDNGVTTALCHWRVATTVPWMNRIAFLLSPFFKLNHSIVMRNGAKCLAKKMNARLVSCSSISIK